MSAFSIFHFLKMPKPLREITHFITSLKYLRTRLQTVYIFTKLPFKMKCVYPTLNILLTDLGQNNLFATKNNFYINKLETAF